ncbi:MAG: hypothetical protein LBF41_10515 [Deltaproteobacteria bacterium]|jgi:hypothetical protein|nr:hypothetical protein [Deltaproteobacteria bacterium]
MAEDKNDIDVSPGVKDKSLLYYSIFEEAGVFPFARMGSLEKFFFEGICWGHTVEEIIEYLLFGRESD